MERRLAITPRPRVAEDRPMLLLLNLGEFAQGSLTVHADRVGLVSETTGFLTDLDNAYTALLQLEGVVRTFKVRSRMLPREFWLDCGPFAQFAEIRQPDPESIIPEFRLHLNRVRIESPGFWEFLGSLNPLQQIREYLNDRHRRRQDRDFRETAEAERLQLENELVQRSIWEKDNAVLRDRIAVLRELGYSDAEIRQLIWSVAGKPLARLGTHQDSQMIRDAE